MKAVQIQTVDGEVLNTWMCRECRKLFIMADVAERCCTPRKCDCGQPIDKRSAFTICDACRKRKERNEEATRAQNATQLTVDQAPEGAMLYYRDEFFSSVDELLEWVSEIREDLDAGGDSWPVYAWVCEAHAPQLNAQGVIDDFYANMNIHDDYDPKDFVTGQEELKAAIEAFNAKQTPSIWDPGKTTVVVVHRKDVHVEDES